MTRYHWLYENQKTSQTTSSLARQGVPQGREHALLSGSRSAKSLQCTGIEIWATMHLRYEVVLEIEYHLFFSYLLGLSSFDSEERVFLTAGLEAKPRWKAPTTG